MHSLALLQQLTATQLKLVLSMTPDKRRQLSKREQDAGVDSVIGVDHLLDLYHGAKIPEHLINELLLSWEMHYEQEGTLDQEMAARFYRCYDKRHGTDYSSKHATDSGNFQLIKQFRKAFPEKFHWAYLGSTGGSAVQAKEPNLRQAFLCFKEILKLPFEDADKNPIVARSKVQAHDYAVRQIEYLIHEILDKLKNEEDLFLLTECLDARKRTLTETEEQKLQVRLREVFVNGTAVIHNEKNMLYLEQYCTKQEKQRILNNFATNGYQYYLTQYAATFGLPITAKHRLTLYRREVISFRRRPIHLSLVNKALVPLRELVLMSPRHQPLLTRTLKLARKTAMMREAIDLASAYGEEIGLPLTLEELLDFACKHPYQNQSNRNATVFTLAKLEALPELVKTSTLTAKELNTLLTRTYTSALADENIRLASDASDALGQPLPLEAFVKFVKDNDFESDPFMRRQIDFAIDKMVERIGPAPKPTPTVQPDNSSTGHSL